MLIFSLFFILIFIVVSGILLWKVYRDTRNKGFWGINFSSQNCPECGLKTPTFRHPTSVNQALFGGWTCQSCGCEIDKWGRKTNVKRELTEPHKQINQPQQTYVNQFDSDGKTPVERIFEENK